MNFIKIIILFFSIVGAIDYILGNKWGLGKEFQKGFNLFGVMALSMIGMIVLVPWLGNTLAPIFDWVHTVLHLDPSIIPASLFANDMGGAHLAAQVAKNSEVGNFNALVVSSMMGCTISFTIPFAMGAVNKQHHRPLAFGLMSGIVTIPFGCFIAGLFCRVPIRALLVDLLPLTILSGIIAVGLLFAPNVCVKVFKGVGFFFKLIIIIGLMLGIVNFLSGEEIIKGIGTIEEGALVCMNAAIVMTGMFPLLFLASKCMNKFLCALGKKLDMNATSMTGIVSSLATSVPTFGAMDEMNEKGIMVNAAFAISASFTLTDHLAFTMVFNQSYLLPVVIGKITAGILAFLLACVLYQKLKSSKKS